MADSNTHNVTFTVNTDQPTKALQEIIGHSKQLASALELILRRLDQLEKKIGKEE